MTAAEFIDLLEVMTLIGFPSLLTIVIMLWKKSNTMQKGIQALLRDRLYQIYDFSKQRGYAPRDIKDNFENIYNWYHLQGSNGVMKKTYDSFIEFPSEPPKEDDEEDKHTKKHI